MELDRHDPKISVLRKALRLLQQCKVPQFCPPTDPDELDRMLLNWSVQLIRRLPRMLDYIEDHRETIFHQDYGPLTWEVRKCFVLVFFEQTLSFYDERASFQLDDEDASDEEERLDEFQSEVLYILTREANSIVQEQLFHHYGSGLAMAGWRCRPGEVYGFARLCLFLVEHNCSTPVHFGSRVLAFGQYLAKELLTFKLNPDYQTMGLTLLERIMNANYRKERPTHDAEDILVLSLRYILKGTDLNHQKLWNVVYYAARSIPGKSPSLDDEIMRILTALVAESTEFKFSLVKALIRMLLLDVPEVQMNGQYLFSTFSISGRVCDWEEIDKYVVDRLNDGDLDLNALRISIAWRLRVGQLIPHLLALVVENSDRWSLTYHLKCLQLLLRVSLFPVGRTGRHLRARLRIICLMINRVFNTLKKSYDYLERQSMLDAEAFLNELWSSEAIQRQKALHEDLLKTIQTINFAIGKIILYVSSTKFAPSCGVLHCKFWKRHTALIEDLQLRIVAIFKLIKQLPAVLERFSQLLATLEGVVEQRRDVPMES